MEKADTIIWKDKNAEKIFSNFSIDDFLDFSRHSSKELQECTGLTTTIMREHADKSTGETNRRMTKININKNIFFLKKARGTAFPNIKNEFEAINSLHKFDLLSSDIAAYLLDEKKREGFVLLKELTGYYSIKELITNIAPQTAIDDFLNRKEDILKQIAEKMRIVHKKGYSYPDLFAKHIYLKEGTEDIVLIDLERFRPLNKCPWYFSFPVSSIFVRNKCWKKFRRSLKSEFLPEPLLKKLLHE
jgi:hypothetical protein